MSEAPKVQRSPVRPGSTADHCPPAELASVRDPAEAMPAEIVQILEMIESYSSWENCERIDIAPQDEQAVTVVHCANYFKVKPNIDRLITAVLMVVALPLMIAVALAILVFDGRPIFYRQTRVGWQGRHFKIWKFRTMCRNAECGTGAVWSCASDPRVTNLGRWLRLLHLDELPQFLNVLTGEMSLIGPRPERPEFVNELVKSVPMYAERLQVRPGISGLSQLKLGYDRSIAGVQCKVVLDLAYIQSASICLDAKILLATLPYIASNFFAKEQVAAVDSKKPVGPKGNLEDCLPLKPTAKTRSTLVKPHSSAETLSSIPQPNSIAMTKHSLH